MEWINTLLFIFFDFSSLLYFITSILLLLNFFFINWFATHQRTFFSSLTSHKSHSLEGLHNANKSTTPSIKHQAISHTSTGQAPAIPTTLTLFRTSTSSLCHPDFAYLFFFFFFLVALFFIGSHFLLLSATFFKFYTYFNPPTNSNNTRNNFPSIFLLFFCFL